METSSASETGPFVEAIASELDWSIMEAMVSITSSSSRIWCRMEILFSSSDTFWDIRRQPSQAECEVGDIDFFVGSWGRKTALASNGDIDNRQSVGF